MRDMMDKKLMKKELLQELIKLMNEEMSGKMMPESDKPEMDEMSDMEMMPEMEPKEPSMVEIEIEKKPLKEGLKDMKEEMSEESEMPMDMEEPEMEEDVDDEDVSYVAQKKFQKGMKKKEQE